MAAAAGERGPGDDGPSDGGAGRRARRDEAAERTAPARRPVVRQAGRATRRCSTRAACSRSSSGTSPATRRRWSHEVCGIDAGGRSRRSPRRSPRNSGRERTTAFVLRRRLDPAHASACSTSAPPRSCRCCSATSAAPAAASWRCAGTPASRARPTSRRCSTCCPATCPMPHAHAARRRSTSTSQTREHRPGFWGNMPRLHRQPAQGLVGRRGDGRERLLLRLPAAARPATTAPTRRSPQIEGEVQGLLPGRREPGGRLRQRPDAAARAGQPRLARRPRPADDRVGRPSGRTAPEIETGELVTDEIGTENSDGRRPRSRCPQSWAGVLI